MIAANAAMETLDECLIDRVLLSAEGYWTLFANRSRRLGSLGCWAREGTEAREESLYVATQEGFRRTFVGKAVLVVSLVAALGVSVIGAAGADVASASQCTAYATNCDYCVEYGVNWYGEACLYGNDFQGVSGTIQTDRLGISDSPNGHVNSTIWIVNPNSGNPYWIEAGISFGLFCENPDCSQTWNMDQNYRLYWEDSRAGIGVYGHVGDVANPDTAYDVKIKNKGNDDWSVSIGSLSGTSTSNPLTPYLLQAGTEETSRYSTSCSEQYNLAYWDVNSNYHDGWGDYNHPDATLESDAPPYAWWVNQDHWVRDRSSDPTCYGVQ